MNLRLSTHKQSLCIDTKHRWKSLFMIAEALPLLKKDSYPLQTGMSHSPSQLKDGCSLNLAGKSFQPCWVRQVEESRHSPEIPKPLSRFHSPVFPKAPCSEPEWTRLQAEVKIVTLSQSQCCPLPSGSRSQSPKSWVRRMPHCSLHFSISSISSVLLQLQQHVWRPLGLEGK